MAELTEPARDLTPLVKGAQRGLRRDVQALLEQLAQGELCIPLARNIAGVSDGQRLDIDDGEVKLVPHMLLDEVGNHYAALFTRPDLMAPMERALGWKTDDGALKFCTVPALFALDMALEVVDDEHVLGLVLNPGCDSELALRRTELASLSNGKAIPLVGYVAALGPDEADPLGAAEPTLIAEGGEPTSPALNAAIERALAALPALAGYVLLRTFNADRDLEPHPTLQLRIRPALELDNAELKRIADTMNEAIVEHLPPPGYIDIVFERRDDHA